MDTTYIIENILRMRSIGNDKQDFEVKEAAKKLPESLVDTISAFSNSKGGFIILGLSERNGFTPVKMFNAQSIVDALAQACRQKLEPPVRPDIDIINFEGAQIVAAYINEVELFDKPCYVKTRGLYSGSYIRISDGDRRLSHYEIDRLLENKTQPRHDTSLITEATLDDLDSYLLQSLLRRERAQAPRVFANLSDENALLNLRVLARDKEGSIHPTLAGLLALGTYPQYYFPRLCISFTAYSGETKIGSNINEKYLDAQDITGPISSMIEESLIAIRRNTRNGAVMQGFLRKDNNDYSVLALREAITNAIMHRDYSPQAQGTQIQINVYSNRVEVQNPGGLYGGINVEELGTSGISTTRNQFLSRILASTPYKDGFVAENRGTGFQLMHATLKESGLPDLTVRNTLNSFTIAFPNQQNTAKASSTTEKSKTIENSPVYNYMKKNREASAAEITDNLQMSRSTVNYQLKKLLNAGIIKRSGAAQSPTQHYRLA